MKFGIIMPKDEPTLELINVWKEHLNLGKAKFVCVKEGYLIRMNASFEYEKVCDTYTMLYNGSLLSYLMAIYKMRKMRLPFIVLPSPRCNIGNIGKVACSWTSTFYDKSGFYYPKVIERKKEEEK